MGRILNAVRKALGTVRGKPRPGDNTPRPGSTPGGR